jgi:hypothetical protein
MKIKDILGEDDVKMEPAPSNMQQVKNANGDVIATGPADKLAAVQQAAKDGVDFTPGLDQQTSEDQEGDANPRTKMIHALAHKMGWGVSDLELLKDHELAALYRKHGDIDEVQSPFPSRNPGTPAAADAAAQAAAPQQPHQSVMPSRNAPTQEAHHDLVSQGNHDVGGDATDRFIDQVRDKRWEKANRNESASLKESDPLYKMLTIAGLK